MRVMIAVMDAAWGHLSHTALGRQAFSVAL